MNFAALPPETNSGLMYTGPGAGPMLAAAAVWDGLAADLHSTATGYQSVVSRLTSGWWLGPSSASMAAAVAPYVGWLTTTAAQAEQTATQARAAATAYETAFAMTVPPPVIGVNRAQVLMLVATNVLGQNTAAIAAAEAHYGEMWAQDATVMYEYAAAAAPAVRLAPFTPPPQTTNPAGPAGQGAAVGQDAAGSAGAGAQQVLSQLGSATANTVQAAPAVAPALPMQEIVLPDLLGLNALAVAGTGGTFGGLALSGGAWASADESTRLILNEQDQLNNVQEDILDNIELFSPLTPSRPLGAVPGPVAPMSAALGQAVSVGNLSVPLNWAAAAPEMRTVAYGLTGTSAAAAPAASVGGVGSAFGEMALAGMGGSALAGSLSRSRGERAGAVTTGERSQPPERAPDSPVAGLVAGIRDLGELRDAGLLTEEEFTEQKQRLLR